MLQPGSKVAQESAERVFIRMSSLLGNPDLTIRANTQLTRALCISKLSLSFGVLPIYKKTKVTAKPAGNTYPGPARG